MIRSTIIKRLKENKFDICIIGGGASGFGCAIAAFEAGLKVCLIDKYDFGKMTSSRSTKLIHGGVRYLAQGRIKLVREALKERKFFLENFRNTKRQSFLLPCYSWKDVFKYRVGLGFYDILSGRYSLGPSRFISRKRAITLFPQVETKGLKGAIEYFDGQFDDARLLLDIAKSLDHCNVPVISYVEANGFVKSNGKIVGVHCFDSVNDQSFEISAAVVINATGVLTNEVLKLDDPNAKAKIYPSRGSHIVIERSHFKGDHALLVPETTDGRVLFAIPWQNKLIIGTTDQKTESIDLDPKPTKEEIDFIINNFNLYTKSNIDYIDILSVFSGLRPLAIPEEKKAAKDISRNHKISMSESGLVHLIGGKWTTFRQMGEDTISFVFKNKAFKEKQNKKLIFIQSNYEKPSTGAKPLNETSIYTWDDIRFAIEHEQCYTIEDVLARRTRVLFHDVILAKSIAKEVAKLLSKKRNKDDVWVQDSIQEFFEIASNYTTCHLKERL